MFDIIFDILEFGLERIHFTLLGEKKGDEEVLRLIKYSSLFYLIQQMETSKTASMRSFQKVVVK